MLKNTTSVLIYEDSNQDRTKNKDRDAFWTREMNPGEPCAGCHMTASRALISFNAANTAHVTHLDTSDDASDCVQTESESQLRKGSFRKPS